MKDNNLEIENYMGYIGILRHPAMVRLLQTGRYCVLRLIERQVIL